MFHDPKRPAAAGRWVVITKTKHGFIYVSYLTEEAAREAASHA